MTPPEPPHEPPAGSGTERPSGAPAGRADERASGGRRAVGASGDFVMDADWVGPHPHPSRPVFRPPAGAVDARCHVFGPGAAFPYAPERGYTPCDAPAETLAALHASLGFDRRVLVQPACHGTDHRALVDALDRADGAARGVALAVPEVADGALDALDRAGVRALRFDLQGAGGPHSDPAASAAALDALAPRLADRGWHAVVDLDVASLDGGLRDRIASLGCPVAVEHLGRPNVTEPVDGPGFSRLVALMEAAAHVWVDLGRPERLSLRGEATAFDDVEPFERWLVERFPDRTLWGSGWPHPHVRGAAPDDGALVDRIPRAARSPREQRALLVDNPGRLYWGEG